jgi:putative ABC transport system permease protein
MLGGGLGLALAWVVVQQGDPTGGMLPIFVLPTRDVVIGCTSAFRDVGHGSKCI